MKKIIEHPGYLMNIVSIIIVLMIVLIPMVVFGASSDAGKGIESGARRIHGTIILVGKWVIIVKGSIDCIQSVLNGEVARAKQQFFGYLLCFGIMMALPWALNEVEGLF